MSRTYKQPSIVSGMTITDIMNMDIDKFNKLNKKDLQKVVGRLVSAGNKRLRSFERSGQKSPATRHVNKSGGVFSTKGKNINELRSEYTRAKNFLQSKTGTRKGWEQVKRETVASLNEMGVPMTKEQFDDVWEAYEDLKELSPSVATKGMKYSVLTDISNMLEDTTKSPEEIATSLFDELTQIYEEKAGLDDGTSGVSTFFEI